jgi:hypothetical protein
MKKLLLLLVVMAGLIMSFIPLILTSTYLFTGFSRQALLDMLTKIPPERFWFFAVPWLIISYVACMWLFMKMFSVAFEKPRKKVYYLRQEDNKPGEMYDGEGNIVEFLDLGKKSAI